MQMGKTGSTSVLSAVMVCFCFPASIALGADQPQWGQRHSRNMVSDETGLVNDFDLETGRNVKWVAPLGTQTWGTPTVGGGKVLIGTNNEAPRDPRHKGDRGILFCLDEKDGSLLWQLVVPKLGPDIYLDWPKAGIVSPPTIENGRAYVVSNRGEVICLDMAGQANGNDGPYRDEAAHMALGSDQTYDVTSLDADIIWLYDIPNQAGTYPHDSAHASVLLDGDFLYVNTSNGVDNTHKVIRRPDGPSLIVLDKNTGRFLARDNEHIGPDIFHSTWSSPALGVFDGKKQIIFAGGNGMIYGFQALDSAPAEGQVLDLKRIWRFDFDPNAPKENIHEYLTNRKVSPSNIMGMPVFHNGRVYVAGGGDIWWGKHQAWLRCFDATGKGDVTSSALVWSQDTGKHCCSTSAIHDGLLFITDCDGQIQCLDAQTGQAHWMHEARGGIWASPLVADGKVYVGTRRKEFVILGASREKKVIHSSRLDSAVAATATAANGVLYVATMKNLYAFQEGAVKP